jgi:MFS family permease
VTEGTSEQDRGVGGRTTRTPAWLAWSLFGLLTCLSIAWSGIELLNQTGSIDALQLASDALISLATPVVFAVVAALILSNQPRNTIGWLLMVSVGAFVVGGPLESYIGHLATPSPAPTVPLLLMVWFSNWGWLLLIFPLLLILLLFPNGRPPTPRWRWVGVAAIAWLLLFVLLATFPRQLATPDFVLDNPIGVLRHDTVELLAGVWIIGLLALVVACSAGLFVRYRRAKSTEREQIKWLLYACALFLVVYIGGTVSGLGGSNSVGGYIWGLFFGLSLMTLPAAIGIAILRYRLYDIDLIINRTLVYGPLTVMLVLVYLGGVVGLQSLLRAVTGQESTLAIVASTLLIAALFNPLRRRIQAFIDRRFYRRKYDAAKTLAAFNARLRAETDLSSLSDDVLAVATRTVQPVHVSLWLRPDAEPEARRAALRQFGHDE